MMFGFVRRVLVVLLVGYFWYWQAAHNVGYALRCGSAASPTGHHQPWGLNNWVPSGRVIGDGN
jgi:hypothetical protein